MKIKNTIGILGGIAITIAFSCLGIQDASAQLNERQIERQASGIYRGKLTQGTKIYRGPGGEGNFRGHPHNGSGKVKVPIKDGRLRSVTKDGELAGNDKAVTTGRERKSKIRRGGNQIVVDARGKTDVKGDTYGPTRNGKVAGKITKKGSKWNANTKMSGKRNEGEGVATYKCTAKGKN